MEKQLILAIGREYGAGGHEIAQKLAGRFAVSFYDRNLLDEMARENKLDSSQLRRFDEKPRNLLLSRTVRGYTNSPEDTIAHMQFDYLKKKADSGESFVIVGRCGEDVLKEYKGLISIFILGDQEVKRKRIMRVRNMSQMDAQAAMYRHDKKRKAYHNYYCTTKWGDSRTYDLTVNSSKLGEDGTIDLLETYIRSRMKRFS